MMLLAQAAEAGAGNTAEVLLFWVFAVLALGSALALITMRNIVHAALMLVLNFLSIAGLYLTLESAFLSIIQVLVYAGAIMVLFLFVIMLLGVDNDDLLTSEPTARVLAVAGGALLAGALLFAFVGPATSPASVCGPDAPAAAPDQFDCRGLAEAYGEDDPSGVAFVGRTMFTRYTYAFELSALLLTVATIGAVILARRQDLAPEDEDEVDGVPGAPADGDDAAALARAGLPATERAEGGEHHAEVGDPEPEDHEPSGSPDDHERRG
ncbi:MAG: NADH-quinone oxidoreductase subunit J [Nitriliruptor sp.]|nr:MAG: NADH-quinone oxidoreductase subunit J [Nitriliruptor sp.]